MGPKPDFIHRSRKIGSRWDPIYIKRGTSVNQKCLISVKFCNAYSVLPFNRMESQDSHHTLDVTHALHLGSVDTLFLTKRIEHPRSYRDPLFLSEMVKFLAGPFGTLEETYCQSIINQTNRF
jgi:hypothetical protein